MKKFIEIIILLTRVDPMVLALLVLAMALLVIYEALQRI